MGVGSGTSDGAEQRHGKLAGRRRQETRLNLTASASSRQLACQGGIGTHVAGPLFLCKIAPGAKTECGRQLLLVDDQILTLPSSPPLDGRQSIGLERELAAPNPSQSFISPILS